MDKRKQIIEVVPYDQTWIDLFELEAKTLAAIVADNFIAAHHVGSTSIPGLAAKPTIDIILEVKDIHAVDANNQAMADFGYEAWGEYRIPGRRFFVKGEDKRTHHVHTFQAGDDNIARHVIVRDYLIAHPEEAQRYETLKIKLAQEFKHNRRGYVENKQDFVKAMEQRALQWHQNLTKGS